MQYENFVDSKCTRAAEMHESPPESGNFSINPPRLRKLRVSACRPLAAAGKERAAHTRGQPALPDIWGGYLAGPTLMATS